VTADFDEKREFNKRNYFDPHKKKISKLFAHLYGNAPDVREEIVEHRPMTRPMRRPFRNDYAVLSVPAIASCRSISGMTSDWSERRQPTSSPRRGESAT
jgi:hypothetical protein